MEFTELNLHPDLLRGIADAGYLNCMPVQEQVLSSAFGGQDLYVQSQTGTGKTAAFLIVIFQRLLSEALLGGKKAIIMVPTRELAVQVEEEAKILGKYLPFKAGSFYGGVGYTQQHQHLRDNVQILVGTPGRVLDLNKSGHMNLMDIAFLVLDEADRMFDMGFYPDLRKLIRVVPPADRRQTMLFSATLNTWVKNLAWEYTKEPLEIEIEPETVTVDEVEQVLYHVPSEEKMRLLLGIMNREQPESAIIFCNTKRYAEIIAKRLRINGWDCEFIIGDLPQVKRLAIIDDIKAGKLRYLAATDVAARGLDIEGLALVVNYDIPSETENYVHRIGRTARAGKTGKAFTLASEQDVYELTAIERYIGKKIPSEVASEDLYGEDKSEGVRIRTDFYDGHDRGGGRDRGRDRERGYGRDSGRDHGYDRDRDHGRDRDRGYDRDRRDGRPGRGRETGRGLGRESPAGRRSEGREGRRPRRDRDGSLGREPPTGRQDGGNREQRGEAGEQRTPLSQLSLEERMAYYREKYEGKTPGEGAPAGGGRQSGGGRDGREAGRDDRGRDGRGRDAGRGRDDPGRGGRNSRGPHSNARSNRGENSGRNEGSKPGGKKPSGQSPSAAGHTPERAEAAPRKGILGKLLGIFKK